MFGSYLKLGLEHILDPNGLDHVLFIVVLTAPFLIKEWKKVIILATAFTVGHSLTLALSSIDFISVNASAIEIGIAVSIMITALYNLLDSKNLPLNTRYLIAGLFGLIHGMGFSNFFKSILGNESILVPLLAFNIGVEVAQIIIVIIVLTLSHILVDRLKLSRTIWLYTISSMVLIWSIKMILERI